MISESGFIFIILRNIKKNYFVFFFDLKKRITFVMLSDIKVTSIKEIKTFKIKVVWI